MAITKIEKEFDEKFTTKEIVTTNKKIIEVAITRDKRSSTRDSVKKIKQFYQEKIQDIVDEMVGEIKDVYYSERGFHEMNGKNKKRQEIIKIAQRWGLDTKKYE